MAADTLQVKLVADTGGFNRAIDQSTGKLNAFGSVAQGVMMGVGIAAVGMAAAGARALIGLGGAAVDAASHLNESMSKSNAIMGASAATILAWSKTSAKALGMTQQQALDASGTFALFGKNAGLTNSQVAKFSTGLVGLAADLGSFYDTSPEDAIQAIGAALRGEAEPIRRYNVLLDDATMRQKALEMGIISSIKTALTPQQKILAATALIYQQTGKAQGDFARTSGEYAGQQKVLAANMDTVGTTIGTAMLPAMKALATSANTLVEAVLPSLGAVVSQTLAPAMLTAADGVTIFAGKLATMFEVIAAGGNPVGAMVDAFDLDPMVDQMNNVIGALEGWTNASIKTFDRMKWDLNDLAIAYAFNMNRIIEAINSVANAGNAFFNAFGAKMAAVTGNAFVATPDIVVQELKELPMSLARIPSKPMSLDRIPTTGGAGTNNPLNVMGDYGYKAAQEAAKTQQDAAEEAAQTLVAGGEAAGKAVGDALAGALQGVPGLMGTSSVTQGDMDRAAAGLPNDYADTWRRRVEDELKNGVDWADVDAAQVAQSVGLDPSVPAAIIIDELNKQWASGEYFANTENIARIDWAAVQAKLDEDAKAALGQKNIVAGALAAGITLESMMPVATGTAEMARDAINSPEGASKWQDAGSSAYSQWRNGWDAAAAGWLIPPPMTESGIPPASGFGGGGPGSTFGGLTQQPGVGASSTTRTGNRSTNVVINIAAGVNNPTAAGRAARSGMLDALRARGQV